jgi:hypothetical protein
MSEPTSGLEELEELRRLRAVTSKMGKVDSAKGFMTLCSSRHLSEEERSEIQHLIYTHNHDHTYRNALTVSSRAVKPALTLAKSVLSPFPNNPFTSSIKVGHFSGKSDRTIAPNAAARCTLVWDGASINV